MGDTGPYRCWRDERCDGEADDEECEKYADVEQRSHEERDNLTKRYMYVGDEEEDDGGADTSHKEPAAMANDVITDKVDISLVATLDVC